MLLIDHQGWWPGVVTGEEIGLLAPNFFLSLTASKVSQVNPEDLQLWRMEFQVAELWTCHLEGGANILFLRGKVP